MLYVPIEMSRKQMYARTQFICAKIVTFCGNDKYFNVSLGYAYYIIKKSPSFDDELYGAVVAAVYFCVYCC